MADEYIKRRTAYSLAKKVCKAVDSKPRVLLPKIILDLIDDLPAADVVPVVRCRDCKHGVLLTVDLGWHQGVMCRHGNIAHKLDWFCADGAKEDGET